MKKVYEQYCNMYYKQILVIIQYHLIDKFFNKQELNMREAIEMLKNKNNFKLELMFHTNFFY